MVKNEPLQRKRIRLEQYDYNINGVYFITICVNNKRNILWDANPVGAAFGRPPADQSTPVGAACDRPPVDQPKSVGATFGRPPAIHLYLSEIGSLIEIEIKKIATIYDCVKIDNHIIMPNHIHLLIRLESATDKERRPKAAPTISRIINQFKGSITKQLGTSIWQKSFYDHIIRNENDYQKIWQYIDENPARWAEDEYYA